MDLRVWRERHLFDADSLVSLQTAYARNGARGYWTRLRELLFQRFRAGQTQYSHNLAEIETYLGNTDEAFRWLETHFQDHGGFMYWTKVDPSLDPLRPDPRFTPLLRRAGLAP